MLVKILQNNHKGDSIVEVLIAITVLAFSLGTGYAIAQKSNVSIQDNKERFQAQQLANQQIELLRATGGVRVDNSGTQDRVKFDTVPSCLKIDTNTGVISSTSGSSCSSVNMGGASIYNIDIECKSNQGNGNGSAYGWCNNDSSNNVRKIRTYTVTVTWPSVKGNQGQVELEYAL